MQIVTIVYVTDMQVSLSWYRALLPDARLLSTSPYWSELEIGDRASLALHSAADVVAGSQMGLALTADRPLDAMRDDLNGRGVNLTRDIADEPFGRSLVISDPDGLGIQVNEHSSTSPQHG